MQKTFNVKNINLFEVVDEKIIHRGISNLSVKDGIIVKKEEMPDDAEEIDLKGRVAFHGFINFHHHIYSQLAKGMPVSGSFSNFLNILENMWWKMDKVLFKEAVAVSADIAAYESIKNGVTTVFDHHASFDFLSNSLETVGKTLEERGIKNVLCFECSDRNGEEVFKKSVEENINYSKNVKDNPNREAMFGLHAPFTLSDKSMKYIKEKTHKNTPWHFHLAEDILDVSYSEKNFNKDIINRLLSYDLINNKTILAHCNHLKEEHFEKINSLSPAIAHNPESNMNNGVGVLNFSRISSFNKIKFLPGTDGMSANILKSIKSAFLLYRHINSSAEIGFDLLQRMILNSKDFGERFFKGLWSFNEGQKINLTVFDYTPYTPINEENFLGHFAYAITENPVYFSACEKILLKEGKVQNYNKSKIFRESSEIARKLWERL
ncbi:MAG: amidohydrolase family protein [Candidatus Muiribacteriota bacterium]